MIDLFYFADTAVRLADISATASCLGFHSELVDTPDGSHLLTYFADDMLHWIPIDPMHRDFTSFEEPQQHVILDRAPICGFIVSLHLHSHKSLLTVLAKLLDQYGGWVGADDNSFERVYDIHDLHDLFSSV